MRRIPALSWRSLPLLAALCVLFLPGALWLLRQVPPLTDAIERLDGPPLAGMPQATAPAQTLPAMWSGQWQRYAEQAINEQLPLRRVAVRATNESYDRLFGSSYMAGRALLRGRDDHLLVNEYITDYCNHSRKNFDPTIAAWAERLKGMRDLVQSRGQQFIYVITPSKVAALPQTVPWRMPCLDADDARPRYRAAIAALRAAGIPFIDGSAMTLALLRDTPSADIFPTGGIHWTLRAATPTAAAVLDTVRYADGQTAVPLRASFTPGGAPTDVDMDLLSLANLWPHATPPYTTPTVRIEPVPPGRPSRKLAAVGGSFVNQLMGLMADTGEFASMDYFYYLDTAHLLYPGRIHQPVGDALRYDALFEADVVLVEENEIKMPSDFLPRLDAILRAGPKG